MIRIAPDTVPVYLIAHAHRMQTFAILLISNIAFRYFRRAQIEMYIPNTDEMQYDYIMKHICKFSKKKLIQIFKPFTCRTSGMHLEFSLTGRGKLKNTKKGNVQDIEKEKKKG